MISDTCSSKVIAISPLEGKALAQYIETMSGTVWSDQRLGPASMSSLGEAALEDRLYTDADLVQYYDLENGWGPDVEFCASLCQNADSLLDLGCGTGLFAARMAVCGTARVTGVDPARAMLEVARSRAGGDMVNWVEGSAQFVRLGQQFDLIVLTGHAFQVFLTEADRRAVLQTIRAHLAPGGRFIFDTRNPLVEEWREWTPEQSQRVVDHPTLGPVRAWNDVQRDEATGIVTYDTFYAPDSGDAVLTARSQIAFPSREELERLLAEAGLAATDWFGDWQGGPPGLDRPEIVVLGSISGPAEPGAGRIGN